MDPVALPTHCSFLMFHSCLLFLRCMVTTFSVLSIHSLNVDSFSGIANKTISFTLDACSINYIMLEHVVSLFLKGHYI